MAELTPIPEPPDGTALLWPARDAEDVPVVLHRDDGLAKLLGGPELRWFTPNSADDPVTWPEAVEWAEDEGYPLTDAQRLWTQEAVDRAVADGGYEEVGDHRIALGSGRCVTHGEVYELPHELDRLRQRVAEEDGRGD